MAQEKQQPKSEGRKGRVESAFAHSSFPTSFTGWDKVRAASEKAATLAGDSQAQWGCFEA